MAWNGVRHRKTALEEQPSFLFTEISEQPEQLRQP